MNKKLKSFLVISRFSEDVNWINELTDNYIIYNKGNKLEGFKQKLVPNIGANQYDIFSFIYENYDNLPDLIAFMQGDPFDHCLKSRFDELIYNESFTSLFGDINYPDGVYYESNNNWYMNPTHFSPPPSKFSSFDEYMNFIFEDYTHLDTLIFPPGSQIIVEKERCLYYSRNFWKKLMDDVICNVVGMNGGIEAHIVERSIQIIFENKFKEKI
jgi:hypothetical protein